MAQVDLTAFEEEQIQQNNQCENKDYKQCKSMTRLLISLKYYSTLNIIENENDAKSFRKFMHDIYYELINDYIHFNNEHTRELEHINNDLINDKQSLFNSCEITSCLFTTRHHNTKTNESNVYLDDIMNFYKQTMDSLHFYLFHCYDVGIRIKNQNEASEQEDEKKDDQYFDAAFSRANKIISNKAHITKRFDRFSTKQNAKFNIKTEQDEEMKNDGDNTTYLDAVYKYLQSKNVKKSEITTLNQFIKDEEYETDSIGYDIHICDGNIAKAVDSHECVEIIQTFMQAGKVSSTFFSIGLRFYYWDYYKERKQLAMDEQLVGRPIINNYNSHSGYSVSDLFVAPRYCLFKEEIGFYKHITIKQYKKEVIVKVNKYIKANIVKKIKAVTTTYNSYTPYVKRYGITEYDPLTFSHLLSVVLYCDYSDLCTDFSDTFRSNSPYETLQHIKQRNSKYYWLSRYLREVVEAYGQCSQGDTNGCLFGPFYTGMNVLLHISEFNIRLCSPTSTSIHIEVAIKFSTEQGIILQFNNNQMQHWHLMCFNVSWLSRYKEEDERLFFGGFYSIQIQSVRIRNTKQNFEEFIHCLFYLDTILTGGQQVGLEISKKDISVIKTLFSNILNEKTTSTFDEYILNVFAAFVQNKTQIILDLHELYEYANKEARNLLIHELDRRDVSLTDSRIFRSDTDCTNLFLREMLLVFKNVDTIIIKTTESTGWHSYSLSLIHLLSLIETTSLKKVIVQATTYKERNWISGYNWIWKLWLSDWKRLEKCYGEKNYTISIERCAAIDVSEQYCFLVGV